MIGTDSQCPTCAPSPLAAAGGLSRIFDTSDFPARWNCGTWSAELGWLHIASDLATWFAYLAIPVMLLVLLRRRRADLPVPAIFYLFCAFIMACGLGHLMEAVIFWWPAYRLAGLIKLATAVVSIATVVVLGRLLPRLLELRGPAELERQVARRTHELRLAQEERGRALRAAEAADRAKSRFLATMSHELRTPIAAILGNIELLLDDEEMDASGRRERLSTIQANARHQVALISDVLELSKIESGRMELDMQPCDLMETAAQALALVEVKVRSGEVALALERTAELPRVVTDPLRLRQILVNLLSNAIRFTDDGEVRVIVGGAVEGERASVRIDVRDTGRGMTHTQLERIFDAYRQAEASVAANRGGTGLGLAISRELAHRLDGDLVAESEHGVGSTFTLTLDVLLATEIDVPKPALPAADEAYELEGTRVLLAEDQRDLAFVVRRQLELAGCSVHHAPDGHAALETFAREDVDIALLDLQMPGPDGMEVARRMRAAGFAGPIVALTANAALEDREACLGAAFDDFATKPLSRANLLALVRRNLRAAERASERTSEPANAERDEDA